MAYRRWRRRRTRCARGCRRCASRPLRSATRPPRKPQARRRRPATGRSRRAPPKRSAPRSPSRAHRNGRPRPDRRCSETGPPDTAGPDSPSSRRSTRSSRTYRARSSPSPRHCTPRAPRPRSAVARRSKLAAGTCRRACFHTARHSRTAATVATSCHRNSPAERRHTGRPQPGRRLRPTRSALRLGQREPPAKSHPSGSCARRRAPRSRPHRRRPARAHKRQRQRTTRRTQAHVANGNDRSTARGRSLAPSNDDIANAQHAVRRKNEAAYRQHAPSCKVRGAIRPAPDATSSRRVAFH